MEKTAKNINNYQKGKEPLRNAVMQHPTGNDVYDFLQKKVNRDFWVTPFKKWQKIQKYNNRANDYMQDHDYNMSRYNDDSDR